MQVLTVIDMQSVFLKRRDVRRCIPPIKKLIHEFQALEWPILLVEMAGCGRTVPWIRKQMHPWTRKSGLNGSFGIIKRCKREKWPLDFVLCGVYRDACVRRTALGLTDNGDVTVITDATRPCNPSSKTAWTKNIANIKLTTLKHFLNHI